LGLGLGWWSAVACPRGSRGHSAAWWPAARVEVVPDRFKPAIGAANAAIAQLGHATASITLDTYGHLFPDELDALAGRLEGARTEALANLTRTQCKPAVVPIREGAGQ
jgi:hypothetical protein